MFSSSSYQTDSKDCNLDCFDSCEIREHFFPGNAVNGNVRLHYLTAGNPTRHPIILLHGLGGAADAWTCLMKVLCKRYYLVAFDRRGTSPSDQVVGTPPLYPEYSFDAHTTDIQQLVLYLGLRNPTIVAHSYAGRIGTYYAFRFQNDPIFGPDKLILLAVSFVGGFIGGPGGAAFRAAAVANDLPGIAAAFRDYALNVVCKKGDCSYNSIEELKEETYQGALRTSLNAYQAQAALAGSPTVDFSPTIIISSPVVNHPANTNPNPTFQYANLHIPVGIFYGDVDLFNPAMNGGLLRFLIPNSFFRELRGVPHFSMLTNYKVLAKEFTKFIEYIPEKCSFCLLNRPDTCCEEKEKEKKKKCKEEVFCEEEGEEEQEN